MRYAMLVAIVLLAGCDNAKERTAEFMKNCQAAKFTVEQCGFLFAMAEKAASDADNATALGAMAVGLSAGASVGRR